MKWRMLVWLLCLLCLSGLTVAGASTLEGDELVLTQEQKDVITAYIAGDEESRDEEALIEVMEELGRSLRDFKPPWSGTPYQKENVLPRMMEQEFLDFLATASIVPVLEEIGLDGIYLTYIDEPRTELVLKGDMVEPLTFVREETLAMLSVAKEDLRALSIENLIALEPKAELMYNEEMGLYEVAVAGAHESGLLLVPPGVLYEFPVKGELIVAVPTTETFLLADSADLASVYKIAIWAKELCQSPSITITDRLDRLA